MRTTDSHDEPGRHRLPDDDNYASVLDIVYAYLAVVLLLMGAAVLGVAIYWLVVA